MDLRAAQTAQYTQHVTTSEDALRVQRESLDRFGKICVIGAFAYLATFLVWQQIVVGNVAYVVLRLLFIVGLTIVFFATGSIREIPRILVGRVRLTNTEFAWMAGSVVVAIAVRLALDFSFGLGGARATFNAILFEVVIPPPNEEIVFRGVILAGLLALMPHRPIPGVIISTLIFAGSHADLNQLHRLIALPALGLLLGTCFVMTRSVLACILVHAVWNLVPFVRGA